MGKRYQRLLARASAYEEAADHLILQWWETDIERVEGERLRVKFLKECARLEKLAEEASNG